ncbi:DUF397 domain-containing protein [Streptomyces sp. NPDC058195]|uniref:DUF397 domain-containing protein n=1 Tax=Streptomyces sp. NPDC058195 TaxID=3346375 RepID=UPI0036EC9573
MISETFAGDAPDPEWFKSSYGSGSAGDSCVEVATAPTRSTYATRRPCQGHHSSSVRAWAGFVPYVAGRWYRPVRFPRTHPRSGRGLPPCGRGGGRLCGRRG